GEDHDGTLGHPLDELAVPVVGALQGEDPLALRAADDQGVDLAAADRLEGLLGLLTAGAQELELLAGRRLALARRRLAAGRHGALRPTGGSKGRPRTARTER